MLTQQWIITSRYAHRLFISCFLLFPFSEHINSKSSEVLIFDIVTAQIACPILKLHSVVLKTPFFLLDNLKLIPVAPG